MPKVILYHNPRCSKSRQTLELLTQNNIQPEIIEYLKTPPSMATIKILLQQLGITARELMRKKETPYQENNLDNPKLTEARLIQAMHEHPILIERPIVIANHKAVIGRPPENVLEIL